MTQPLDDQRAAHRNGGGKLQPAIPNDEFLIAAVHQFFVRIEAARARGAQITPRGRIFLAEISQSILSYLGGDGRGYEKLPATENKDRFQEDFDDQANKCNIFYPEGGLEAWLVVLGSSCGLLCSIGITNIMGTFQTYIAENQLRNYDESAIGWIFSLYAFLAFFCGIYVGPIFDKHGPRWLVLAGSMCVVADMMLLGLCTEYWHFLLCFGGLGGIGTALMFTPCIAAIGHYFNVGRGNATGIAVSSGALGGIAFPLMLQNLLPKIGFAWTTRTLGCIYLILAGIANLLVKSRLQPIKGASSNPDFRIFKKPAFALTVAGVFLLEWAIFVPLAYITSYATAQNFSLALSYDILIFFNVGSFFGRVIPGYIADRLGRYNTNITVILLAVISIFAVWLPFGKTYAGLTIFALIFGFASGSNISLAPVCLGDLCQTQEYGRYYATCFSVVSFGCLTGIPLAGELIQSAGGEYWGLILFTGFCYVGGLMAFTVARVLATGWKWNRMY